MCKPPRPSPRSVSSTAVALACFLAVLATDSHAQVPKQGPLMTRFAKDVDPARPLPEYPRPQLVRADWLNLNGVWQYQPGTAADEAAPVGKTLSGQIIVPFPVESALSGVMEPHDRLWYRRTFTVPPAWQGKHVLLHFGAVDYESETFLNGRSLGVHRGGYDEFSYDVTSSLQGTGEQELIVRVFDPTETAGQPRGKQTNDRGHITYTPTSGIWQTVWLEPVAPASIQDLRIVPDVDASVVRVTVAGTGTTREDTVKVQVKDGGKVVQSQEGQAGAELTLSLPAPRLWSPETPFLYDVEVTLRHDGQAVDTVGSYFGLRKIALGEERGVKKTFLNNRFVFQFGPLDQGFWPDGLYTAPTDAALKSDIEAMKAAGFNFVRKHIKVEPQRWYYWCDRLGLMVWQDMPSPNSYLPRNAVRPPVDTEAFRRELTRLVETHRNHPSIVMWVPFNESQGQHDTPALVDLIKKLDPTRLVNQASGGRHEGVGDIMDIHAYPAPACPAPNATMALACGEYGGIGLKVDGHLWSGKGHGYLEATTPDDLLYYYGVYADSIRRLRDTRGLSAVVYTEITDVEQEVNGLLTYDRVPKADLARFAAFSRPDGKPGTFKTVLATSEETPQTWRYTMTAPGGDQWRNPSFDDAAWQEGPGGFGKQGSRSGPTEWTTSDLWLRKHFNPGKLSTEELAHLVQRGLADGELQVYINGVEAFGRRVSTGSGNYQTLTLREPARQVIKPDADNVLAVHCRRQGDKFLDVGLSVFIPTER